MHYFNVNNAYRRLAKRLYALFNLKMHMGVFQTPVRTSIPINSTSLLPQSCSFSRFLLFFFSSSLIQCCCCFVFLASFADVFYFVFFGDIWFYNVDMILLLFFYILLVVLILYIWVSCFMNYSCYCLCLYILFFMCM